MQDRLCKHDAAEKIILTIGTSFFAMILSTGLNVSLLHHIKREGMQSPVSLLGG